MISYHDDDDDDIFLLPSSAPLALVKGPCAPYFTIEAVTLSLANLPTYHAKYSIVEPCHASSSFLLCCLHFCCGKSG